MFFSDTSREPVELSTLLARWHVFLFLVLRCLKRLLFSALVIKSEAAGSFVSFLNPSGV